MKMINRILTSLMMCLILPVHALSQLPEDFPTLHSYKTGETGDGYIFLTVSSDIEGIGNYVLMIDDTGEPFKYLKAGEEYTYDFKVQPSGLISYAQFLNHFSWTGGGDCIHMVLDEELNPVDSFQLKNGYAAEAHDFQLLPNGHVLAFGYYLTQMDLSDIVEGGYPNALVSGGVIQELDQDKNVVWQWRSWDHYDPAEYEYGNRGENPIVSRFHLNTINLDYDDNILIETPRWTKKINRQTGEIMWHLGGFENEFSFVGVDSLTGVEEVIGHAFYMLENGNYLNYDNAPRQGAGTSKAHEYKLDQTNLIAEKIMTITPDTNVKGNTRGNAQRLPNGNTMVGWGGGTDGNPVCTEFDSFGNTVLKVFFDHPEIKSYRAVRHPFPPTFKHYAFEEEVAEGNTYDFMQGDTLDVGVKVKITSLTSVGYNELRIHTHDYAPRFPRFNGRAPMVLSKKVVMSEQTINYIGGEISFNIDYFNIKNPDDITVYHRTTVGSGEFSPLTSTYNSVTGMIKAEFDGIGEFIFAYSDIGHVAIAPLPAYPLEGARVNYLDSVKVEWSPQGFFEHFDLQVAYDMNFSDVLLDSGDLGSTILILDSLEVNRDYYWRVRTSNDAGLSEWSDTAHFSTEAPYIDVTAPAGNEIWTRGLEHFIEWDDNLGEDVILDLYHADTMVMTIDTVESRNAFLWEIPVDVDSACMYHIRITSLSDSSVFDVSDTTFSINDSTCTGTTVPSLKVESPNGGEVYESMDTLVIQWDINTGDPVSIDLYKADTVYLSLRSTVVNDSIHYVIPDEIDPGSDFRISVMGEGNLPLSDASNSDFEIKIRSNLPVEPLKPGLEELKVYPNPVSSLMNIEYTALESGSARLQIFNLAGVEVASLSESGSLPGRNIIQYNMEIHPQGTYVIRLQCGERILSIMVTHLK